MRSDLLKVDVLPLPPNRLKAARSNRGTDFWLTFLANASTYYEPEYRGMDLYISADVDTAGKADIFGWQPCAALSSPRRFDNDCFG